MTDSSTEVGVIKSIHKQGGYGFIRLKKDDRGEKRSNLYFHASECDNEFDDWEIGMKVKFSYGEDSRGRMQAINAERVEDEE